MERRSQGKVIRLGIRVGKAAGPAVSKAFGEPLCGWDDIEKAITHKYIKRWPAKNGKGWEYLYAGKLFSRPMMALAEIFGIKNKKIEDDFAGHNIQKNYGADKKTFAAHVLEYLSNRVRWDAFFANRENQAKYKNPQPSPKPPAPQGSGQKTLFDEGKKNVDGNKKKGDNKVPSVNKSLMRKIWGMYGGKEAKDGADKPGTRSETLPSGTPAVRPGRGEGAGDQHGNGAENADDGRESLQLPFEFGERSGRDVSERLTPKQSKDIRQACLDLLASKSDGEMTAGDRDLLRLYEGAGGLGENASTHGTLYEFYTPRTVTKKVWQIVDKYIPGAKSVLEPSAGTGRFAEDRPDDKFTLNEYDRTSSRIGGILHPDAETKQGAFQEMFRPGKEYGGRKFDVVIGNPPYGKYEGLWKGRGEGKEHTRYEEYFIDRGLDTLREGGIMAFVVPSSFLRGGNSKIKEKIAGKGKLLEAWRLPNGTFSTTGVGTDIVIIRREKGEAAAFSDNAYFNENPAMVVGTETTRTGRFGTEQYVALESGVSFDEAVGGIKADAVEAVPAGEKTARESALGGGVKAEAAKSEAEKRRNRSDAMKGNRNAKKDGGTAEAAARVPKGGTDTIEEFNAKYNKHIEPKALGIWKATNWDGSIDLRELHFIDPALREYLEGSGNYVKSVDGNWYDVVNFASGNIYEKLDRLEERKDTLSKKEYARQKAILEKALPEPQPITGFEVSPLSDIADKFTTGETGQVYNMKTRNYEDMTFNLKDAFKEWIRNADRDDLAMRVTKQEIYDFVDKRSVRMRGGSTEEEKEANRMEAQRKKTQRREDSERLFTEFIREHLDIEDQKRLEDTYNRQYRGTVQPDYGKIPIFLDGISKTFKGKQFRANESQMKANSWLANQGNGIVALDVGVGKTITAIMAANNDLQMGRCKKPLVVVPKSVIENWKLEISELFPDVRLNDLGNFGDIGRLKGDDGKLRLEEGSISVCTYEALEKIGFTDGMLESDLKDAFTEALSATADGATEREKAKEEESIMTKVGKATKTGDNWVNWEDTGFDHITVDEAHNFRNSFSKPRTKDKGDSAEFADIPGGSTSLRGLKLFAVSQMVQKYNNGRNVHLLTATPFQNSPVEIYNMLSLVAREELKKAGIFNFNEFLVQFAELKPELAVDSKNNMVQKNVMKGFKNLPALQALLDRYVMKIDGEDAGIIRPDKKEHQVFLDPTPEQRDVTEKIRAYMESNPDPKKDPGATLRCINALRQAALSPVLVDGFEFLDPIASGLARIKESRIKIGNGGFVKDSPKMKFIADTAAGLYGQNPDKGQIIHLPQGIEHYEAVRDYLVSQGVPADAIAFMAPAPKNAKNKSLFLPAGDKGNDVKEERKNQFNDPNGKVKIIIGSDTIKEGVNLNGNTIQTYASMLDWNPTGTLQLIGRSHRQGNAQGNVHITFPLMNDSVDSFMYQKHDEKKSRLDALWKSKETKMEIDEINPEELKLSLIKDPKKRARLVIRERTSKLEQEMKIAEATGNRIAAMAAERRSLSEEIGSRQKEIADRRKAIEEFNGKTDAQITGEYELNFNSRWGSLIRDSYGDAEGKDIKELRRNYVESVKTGISDEQKTVARCKGKAETLDNAMMRYGINETGNQAAAEKTRKKFSDEARRLKSRIEAEEKNFDRYLLEAERQIKAEARPGETSGAASARITALVSGDLYPMSAVHGRIAGGKDAKTLQKSACRKRLVIRTKRRTAKGATA